MSLKRKMAEEEDEHGRDNLRKKPTREWNKSAKRKQKFKIYHTEFLTAANRDERKKTSVTLELNEDTSEREIRNSLVSEFSQLRDKNFKFFTKDKEGKCYYCPCKPKCNEDHFKAEWNASNITKMVKGDRPVHILIEDVSEADGPSSGYGTTDNHRPSNPSEDELLGEASLMDYVTDRVSLEPPLEIKQIVPQEGKVEGGCTFFLELKERCVDEFKVQFGETDPIGVERINEITYKGTVPASSHAGVVAVKIVKTLKNCKNTIAFTYIEEGLEKKPNIREILGSMDEVELEDLLLATAKQFGEMNVKSNKEKTRYGDSGGGKNHSLPLLRMIADTAARINAITFFEILFRTNAGCTLFKSFKDSQPPLEEIARLNGHTELALMLEKKHLMFRDDENDSDDEVDWKAISEKIGEYQAEHDDPVEKWSLQSRDSFKSVHGYLADQENSSSLSSLQVSVGETNHEGVLEEEQAPQVLQALSTLAVAIAGSEMVGAHKFLEGKIKLIVRSFSEPVLFPFDDKVGRTTFSPNGVESLGKKLTSCSTKDIGDDEAYCSFLRVEDLDGYPKTTKIVTGRKSFLEINERKELQRLPDHHNFNNSRCHVDVVCSLENSHIADNPLCYEEKDSLEIDERLPCVYVNDSSTEPSPTSNSSPLNNGGGKSKFFRMCCKVTLILSMFTIVAIGLATGSKYLTTADPAKPEGTYQGATPGNMRGHKTSFPPTPQNPCKKTQHWVENAEGPPQCIDCQACPPGQTISPECGNSKPLTPDTTVFCVPCQLGKSFSSEYSTSVCIPCSSCFKDQVVIKNCTRQADIECGKKCYSKDRYYDESKRGCLKCSKCCNDDRDMVESECIEKLGSQSSIICSVHSSFQRCNIKSTPKFVSHSTTESSQSSAPTTSSHIATEAFSNTSANVVYRLGNITHSGIRGRFASRIKDQNDSYITITVTVVLLVLVIVTGIYLTWFCKLRSPTYSRVDSDGGTYKEKSNKSDGKVCTSACQDAEQLVKLGSTTLDELDVNHAETFDCMCMKLDQESLGMRNDFERLATCYKLSPTVGSSLKQEFRHGGSPSSALMDHIKAKHPNLPTHQLIEDQEKIGRKDIAEGLKSHVFRKEENSPTPEQLVKSDGGTYKEKSNKVNCNSGSAAVESCEILLESDGKVCTSACQDAEQLVKLGHMTLEKLDENHVETFDWMCMKLNQKRSGTRYDFERLATCYKLSPTERRSLKQEFYHRGSPSSALMDHIKAKHPNLPIHQLIEDLEKIGRKDIAEGLKSHVFRKEENSTTPEKLVKSDGGTYKRKSTKILSH